MIRFCFKRLQRRELGNSRVLKREQNVCPCALDSKKVQEKQGSVKIRGNCSPLSMKDSFVILPASPISFSDVG